MSCHDIGHALNTVTKTILELLDAKRIDKETARILLHRCERAVYWCDGNEYEATASLDAEYCGICLQKQQGKEWLYSVYATIWGYHKVSNYQKEHNMVGSMMCEACFDKMCAKFGLTPLETTDLKNEQKENGYAKIAYSTR